MNILRLSLLKGVQQAQGLTVIIDVFRAFTCEPLMFHYGATQIILESDIETCKKIRGDAVLVGEENSRPIESFDLSNSPSEIIARGTDLFSGREVIHRTSAGVLGVVSALERTDEVLLASFVIARATAEFIVKRNPDTVSLVAMGLNGVEKTPEDEFCGDYIESMLTGKPYDHLNAVSEIIRHESAQKFLRGDTAYLPPEDPLICLQRDLFDYALCARREGEVIIVRKVIPEKFKK